MTKYSASKQQLFIDARAAGHAVEIADDRVIITAARPARSVVVYPSGLSYRGDVRPDVATGMSIKVVRRLLAS